MDNVSKLTIALTEWAKIAAKSAMPQLVVTPTSSIGKMMSFIGVNPATYNIYDELGFLLTPTLKSYIEPHLRKFFKGMPEEEIMSVAMSYIDACEQRAVERGHVNIFGVELGANAFTRLREIVNSI